MVISVGERPVITTAARQIARDFPGAAVLVQDATILKRDGQTLSPPPAPAAGSTWQLAIYASVRSQHHGGALGAALLDALRSSDATGATALRGIWGYHGDQEPHGDRFWSLTRQVPLITVTATHADRAHAAWQAIDDVTNPEGLVVLQHATSDAPSL